MRKNFQCGQRHESSERDAGRTHALTPRGDECCKVAAVVPTDMAVGTTAATLLLRQRERSSKSVRRHCHGGPGGRRCHRCTRGEVLAEKYFDRRVELHLVIQLAKAVTFAALNLFFMSHAELLQLFQEILRLRDRGHDIFFAVRHEDRDLDLFDVVNR